MQNLHVNSPIIIGYKLLASDEGSLTSYHERVFYKIGVRTTVPGNGAYVSVTGGLFSLEPDSPNKILAVFECEEPIFPSNQPPQGTTCFRHVTRIPLNDEDLVRIAAEAADPDVRQAAVARVGDQALLARVAAGDTNPGIRRAAVERVEDQALLARVAAEDADPDVRWAAVERVDDQALLARPPSRR